MSNLEGKLSQNGNAVILTQANPYLAALNSQLQTSIGQSLNVINGYMSKFEIIDELRLILSPDEANTAPDNIKLLLDKAKPMTEIAVVEADFNALEVYVNELATNTKGVFDPPLGNTFTVQGFNVYPIPQPSDLDPRRFGRLFTFESFAVDVRKWLINNALLYGFTLYEDYGLYYIGFNEARSQSTSVIDVRNLINKFQQTAIPAGEITITATQIQAAEDPMGSIPFIPAGVDPSPIINPNKIGANNAKNTPVYIKGKLDVGPLSKAGVLQAVNAGKLTQIGDANQNPTNFAAGMDTARQLDGKYYLETTAAQAFLGWFNEMKQRNVKFLVSSAIRFGSNTGAGPHGYGVAVDFSNLYQATDPKGAETTPPNLAARISSPPSADYKTIAGIGAKYGWYNPWRMAGPSGFAELWHFEYWGPA